MTFFVCFSLLLGFLILEIEYYILYSDSKFKDAMKNVAELGEKLSKQTKENLDKLKNSDGVLDKKVVKDNEAEKKEFPDFEERTANRWKKSSEGPKQDSSNVVDDGSEPTPLTDLDGGD